MMPFWGGGGLKWPISDSFSYLDLKARSPLCGREGTEHKKLVTEQNF